MGDTVSLSILMTVDPRKEPEKAFMALSIAASALASDTPVRLFFALDGVWAATKNYLDGIVTEHTSLKDLLAIFVESGGELIACQPFLLARKIAPEDLVDGVTVASAPTLVGATTETNFITL